jgi:hypothetical protein
MIYIIIITIIIITTIIYIYISISGRCILAKLNALIFTRPRQQKQSTHFSRILMEIAFLDVSPFYINVVRIHFEHFLTKHTHQATTWQGVAPIGITHLVKGDLNRLIAAALSATVSDPGTLDRRAMENHGNTGKPMGTKHRDVANPIINGRI